MINEIELVSLAIKARQNAYAPYSEFLVGAALLTETGNLYTGCNIENAAYSPTNCAERTAFFKAISEGERNFKAIAIAGWKNGTNPDFAFPCGVCRQVMMEFCKPNTFKVIVAKSENDYSVRLLCEILPHGFGPNNIL